MQNKQYEIGLQKFQKQVLNNDYIEDIEWTIAVALGEVEKDDLKEEFD
ncbi:hypothetical protein [Metabacillus fastidiosus]